MKKHFFHIKETAKKSILFVLSLSTISLVGNAQSDDCPVKITPEHLAYVKKTEAARSAMRLEQTSSGPYYVPVKIHIVRRADGTGGANYASIQNELMNITNARYAAAGIVFFECSGANYINDNAAYSNINAQSISESNLVNAHKVPNVINIFYTNSLQGGSACGYTYLPQSGRDWVMMSNSCSSNGSTLPHELGHYFNLYHTHEGTNEGVNRNPSGPCYNCNTNGDMLCDTPADPILSSSNVNSNNVYIGTSRDACGVLHAPDTKNVMNYSPNKAARTYFSPGQISRIRTSYLIDRNYLKCDDIKLKLCFDQSKIWDGNVNGDATKDILTYNPRTHNWWFGKTVTNGKLDWINANNTVGFGALGSNHMILNGDFDGDGNLDVCFYHKGDQNWFMGLTKNNSQQWSYMYNTAGFGNNMMDGQRTFWVGDVDGDKKDDIVMYVHYNGDWFASISGSNNGTYLASWKKICNTSDGSYGVAYGNIGTSAYKIWPGDYNGDGKLDFLFYYSGNKNWHVGLSDGMKLNWYSSGSTAWAGELMGGNHTIYKGDFDGDKKQDMLFYHKLDGNWFMGKFSSTSLNWGYAGNTSVHGNMMTADFKTLLGDFNGDAKTDVLFHKRTNATWYVGYSSGSTFAWNFCGNTSAFGSDIINGNFKYFVGNFDGTVGDEVLFNNQANGNWEMTSIQNNAMSWRNVSSTGACDGNNSLRETEEEEYEVKHYVPESEGLIHPNPITSGFLNFGKITQTFSLINSTGALVKQGSACEKMDVTGLPKGIYLLELDGKTQKVIIQ